MDPLDRIPSAEGIRVLHVDDDPGMREVVGAYLEREREAITVESKDGADSALQRLSESEFDCVVSDYQMPGMDGMEFLRTVREDHPDLPFVLFTGEGSENLAGEAISAGVTDYIQKGGTEQYTLLANRVVNAVEQYRASRKLRRQTDLFEKTQQLANVGGWEYDIETDQVTWSDGLYRILGANRDRDRDLDLDAVAEIFHPEDRPKIRSAVQSALEDGDPYDLELRVHGDADETRWIRIRGELQYEDGEKVRLRGTAQDVTERKRRERRLRDHTATIEALHRAATDIASAESVEEIAALTVTAARDLLDFRICSVLYYRDGLLEPVAISEDSPEDGARPVPADGEGEGGLAGKSYRTGESYTVDEVRPDDESDPAREEYSSGISVPIGEMGVFQAAAYEPNQFDEDDVERAELLTAHTASALERVERERELREQNERLDQFARVVSHDLRNPIQVLRGGVELAVETGETDYLGDAVDSLDRMERIVTDLLTIAREGDDVDGAEPMDLATVIEESWEIVDTEGATLSLSGLEDCVVVADRSRLRQLLENLFRNCVEHGSTESRSQTGDSVEHGSDSTRPETGDGSPDPVGPTVRAGWIDGDAQGFYVADDGPGIPPEEREDVFETGFSTSEDGTGFGLAIVDRVATAHGWSVAVTEGRDGGARFEITGVETR